MDSAQVLPLAQFTLEGSTMLTTRVICSTLIFLVLQSVRVFLRCYSFISSCTSAYDWNGARDGRSFASGLSCSSCVRRPVEHHSPWKCAVPLIIKDTYLVCFRALCLCGEAQMVFHTSTTGRSSTAFSVRRYLFLSCELITI